MVYLTGDTHGELDRFKHGRLRWLGKRDIVVVLGDFGFVWDGSVTQKYFHPVSYTHLTLPTN